MSSPLATAVQVRKGFNLSSLDRVDEARETLTRLLGAHENETTEVTPSAADATPTPAASDGTSGELAEGEVLKIGSRGELVQTLQAALKARGFDIEAEGAFGEGTR